ncbi:MAG: WD40 repeat domain-containing protein, partial [Verrucomicrobiae bacterium]|nr:WD40 repeat domain-containing protein [Verrucomicrobiae bacterium]
QQVKPLETAFSPDGSKVAISGTDGAWIWEPDGGKATWAAQGLLGGKSARVAFSRDQRFLAIGGGSGNLVLHDLDGGEERTLDGHAAGIHAMALSPSGACLATASEDRTLKLWSMENARLTHPPFEHRHTVWSVAFSPDGTIVATGSGRETAPSEGELRLYSVRTGQLVADIVRLPGRAVQVAYSPDGRWLAAACAELAFRRLPLLLLDTTTAQPPPFRLALEDGICQVAFSPDSKRIAASDEGGMMRIWSLVDGAPLTPVFRHRRGARVLSFDSRGAVLLSGSLDGTARLWSGLTAMPLSNST